MRVLREDRSKTGCRVRLTQDQGTYTGAKPYYIVSYVYASEEKAVRRYTPFLERAEVLFDKFMHDITDPSQLREPLHG